MIFTFICFLTSIIFWLVFASLWRILFASKESSQAAVNTRALHEKTIHSFSTYIGLLITAFMSVFLAGATYLKGLIFVDIVVFFLLAACVFVSSLYLIRVARSYF